MPKRTCGTVAAYNAHIRSGEVPDEACRAANAAYKRERRAQLKTDYQSMGCLRCGATFTPQRSDNAGYCSANCSSAHGQQLRRMSLNRPRQCEWCCRDFIGKHVDARCCSTKCRNRAQVVRRHGLTPKQYRQLLARQNERCAICEETLGDGRRDKHIDHCHESGVVRGILCPSCNLMLGHAHDNPTTLLAAISYLSGVNIRPELGGSHTRLIM